MITTEILISVLALMAIVVVATGIVSLRLLSDNENLQKQNSFLREKLCESNKSIEENQ